MWSPAAPGGESHRRRPLGPAIVIMTVLVTATTVDHRTPRLQARRRESTGAVRARARSGHAEAMSTAHDALTAPWHLAVLTGAETGTVIPLTARTTVGRGCGLEDATVSRHHLTLRVRTTHVSAHDAGSANGTHVRRPGWPWRRLRDRPVRCPDGTLLRIGQSVLQVRRRPSDLRLEAPGSPARGRRWTLLLLAPVLLVAPLMAVLGHRSPWSLLLMAPMVLMMVLRLVRPGAPTAARQRRGRLPDTAGLLLSVAARSQPDHADAAPSAWLGPQRRRRTVLALGPGDRVCLQGPHARAALAWWTAQVLAHGGTRVQPTERGVVLTWGRGASAHRAELMVAGPDGPPGPALHEVAVGRRVPWTGPAWWHAVLTTAGLVPTSPSGSGTADGAVPQTVRLEQVTGPLTAAAVQRRWARSRPGTLSAVLGSGPGGTRTVDLVGEGPHALVAGTTGSGKSELLTSWLVQLAASHPPSRLSLVLVDYKGGATFAPLARLPHTAGVLTDLDPAATARALTSLTAEVHRRERLLAELGAKDVAGVAPEKAPARLVVVVDEFATLAAEHPDVLDTLVRVAAQGRSLGIHLVLATQRPAGNVSAAIRANTTVRVCLRVLDVADSRDVLGHDGAAHLEACPGRVLVGEDPTPVQSPWCGREDHLAGLVEALTQAAQVTASPWRPWADPLPARVAYDEVAGSGARQPSSATEPVTAMGQTSSLGPELAPGARWASGPVSDELLLAVTDLPTEQRQGTWSWDPARPLLVLGAPGSGRTTALDTTALAALAAGRAVHRAGMATSRSRLRQGRAGVGTVVGPGEPRRLARLLGLATEGALAGDLLVIDDVDALLPALDQVLGPGQGQLLAETLARTAPASGTGLVLAGPLTCSTARWSATVPTRLVLGAALASQAALAGLPHRTVTGRGPGRGVILEGAEVTHCQVLLPTEQAGTGGHGGSTALCLSPLPRRVILDDLPTGAIGRGGDDAAVLTVPVGPGVLVVGPPGSGRSTALATLAHAMGVDAKGRPAAGEALADDATEQAGPTGPIRRPASVDNPGDVVVIDDLDLAGVETQARVEQALAHGSRVLASAATDRVAATYRGPLATLRERGAMILLWPGVGPATQVAGTSLRGSWDPEALTMPGRGVLIHRGRVVPLQVAQAPSPEDQSADMAEPATCL